jgi:hypothetical protein
MFALLIPLLASLPGLIGNFFKQKNDILQAQAEVQRQIELAKIDMAKDIAVSQMNLNATIIQSTSPVFKYFTFAMWFGPFVLGIIDPTRAAVIFNNMGGMPQFYVTSCVAIMFTVWGISVSANAINGIFSGLGDFFSARRDYKLEKAKVDRKAYYDSLRVNQGYVTGDDVKRAEAIFDQIDKGNSENG